MESQQTVKLQTIVSTKKKVRHMERKFSGRIAGCIQKIVLLTASAVTAFPFLWMVLSALKTKEEVMDVNVFFPADPQWQNCLLYTSRAKCGGVLYNRRWDDVFHAV